MLPAGEQSSHWVSDRPMPIAGFNLGKYLRVAARAGDVSVEAYASSGVERTFPQGSSQALAPPPTLPFPAHRHPEADHCSRASTFSLA